MLFLFEIHPIEHYPLFVLLWSV